ncbi:MAG: hypothetical protein JNM93_01115 [Bacteriovoracaceae bacterium]|nr:hypothetical protein [Bacteriovoracaceae bacterium]
MILILILLFSSSSFAKESLCRGVYKNRFERIKAYKLINIFESKSLCGYDMVYTQDGNTHKEQIIVSKNSKEPVLKISLNKLGLVDICEHSLPIDHELQCATDKDYFSKIAEFKNEKVTQIKP